MIKFIKINNKNYIFNIFSVAGGTFISQLITFLSSPILSRAYSPSAFGHFSIYSATVSIIAVISCARYELAISLPKEISKVINICKTAFVISFVISLVALLVIIGVFTFTNNFIKYSYLIYPFIIILNGLGLCLILLHNKLNNFLHSSISKILQALAISIVSIFISNIFVSNGLIIGSIIGQIINIIYLIIFLPKNIRTSVFSFSFQKFIYINVLFRYRQFPKLSLFPAFLNIFSSQIPTYLITLLYGSSISGYYFFSLRLVVLPVTLIGSSINDVFFQRIIEKKNSNQPLIIFFKRNLFFLFSVGIFFFICFFFFSDIFIPLLFGNQWKPSVMSCKILSVSMFVKLVVSPLTMTLVALNKIEIIAYWQYFYFFGLSVISLFIYLNKYDFMDAQLFFVIFDFLAYCICLYLIMKNVYKYDATLVK